MYLIISLNPFFPVPAFALPAFIKQYRGLKLDMCFFAIFTGAAQKRFFVNTPTTLLPLDSSIKVRSLRFF